MAGLKIDPWPYWLSTDILAEINRVLDEREQSQHERNGKHDDLHFQFAHWLLEKFDEENP